MTTPTDQLTQFAHRGQEAVDTAVRAWTDALQAYSGAASGHQPQLPDLHAAVDVTFDLAARLLTAQRESAKALVDAVTGAVEAATEQATQATSLLTEAGRTAGTQFSTLVPAAPAPATPAPAGQAEGTPKRGRAPRDVTTN